ncbi:SOS response-associated peptidase [Lachnoclostridium sp. An138]|uniref:SOS response-associated peptidase n=1 Tax=Lachnoclostridium sp. An138 TaxID=1965560 RepID=UPI000B396212|nr:SOS response-associated peptidase family protein [Lachnoclostridium sp. An138]OUQ18472.1 hypothetical protein B5E82_07705 [Lachnoclostridium sp. An138]
MCGRFYVDGDVWEELRRLAERTGSWELLTGKENMETESRGDVFPSCRALVLRGLQSHLDLQKMKWGYEAPGLKKEIINARSETVREKHLFCQDFAYRRCLIPARGFYEWKRDEAKKVRYRFYDGNGILYLAGIYHASEQGDEFAILTRKVEGCMLGIHDRMPVLIRQEDVEAWLFSGEEAGELLNSSLQGLKRERAEDRGKEEEYEQLSLF